VADRRTTDSRHKLLALIALTLPFVVGYTDGNTLLNACEHAESAIRAEANQLGVLTSSAGLKAGQCYGFVEGIDLAMSVYAYQKQYCPPDEANLFQKIRIVRKFLEGHPRDLHYAAGPAVMRSLLDAYPCPAQ
jgi:hypothetical protein